MTLPDHVLYQASDDEPSYLCRAYDDGSLTISTRPVGGFRWSPEVTLVEQTTAAIVTEAAQVDVTTLVPAGANGVGS